jgi:hypothetical protein
MLKGKTLFLIAILSWVSTSEALAAYCSVVRSSPIVNDWKQTIGSVSSGCFEPRDPNLMSTGDGTLSTGYGAMYRTFRDTRSSGDGCGQVRLTAGLPATLL